MLNNRIPAQVLRDILIREMVLPPDTVWIRDQNKLTPNDDRMYVIIGTVAVTGMSVDTTMIQEDIDPPPDDPPFTQQVEISQVNQRESIQIDIVSRSNDALKRHWEMLAALNSIYSKQQQEANYFKIFRLPNAFVNTSLAEGGSQLNRFSLTFSCFAWYRKRKVLSESGGDYYDDFTTRVDDANTIGTDKPLIEFEITPESDPP